MTPSKYQLASGAYKNVDGVWHKRCSGPGHSQPTFLPATEKYFYKQKSGTFVSYCRLCSNWGRVSDPYSPRGLIPVKEVQSFFVEATNRVGVVELAHRSGVSASSIHKVIYGKTESVRAVTVRKVLLQLISMRRKGEFSINGNARRHRDNRNLRGSKRCTGCGASTRCWTAGCRQCWDRHRSKVRWGTMTQEEFDLLKPKGEGTC